MLSDEIMDEERLFRAVPNQPTYWKPKEKRYSSAMFKQSKGNGISVDRDGGRTTEAIVASFARSRPEYGLVVLTAGKCREIGTHPVAKPTENNDYHAEIHESPSKIEITSTARGY